MCSLAVVASLAGCGRLGFEPDGVCVVAIVGALTATGCGRLGFDLQPFEPEPEPVALVELNAGSLDEDPALSTDLLEIYFASNRAGAMDIWRSTRPSLTASWDAPAPVVELNSLSSDVGPELSDDGLTLFFASSRAGSAAGDVYVTTRADRQSAWATPMLVGELNSTSSDDAPTITTDLLWLALARDQQQLFSSSRTSVGDQWSSPALILELDSAVGELSPDVDGSGTRIVFASDRSGSRDLWMSTRLTRNAPFSPPIPLDAVNTSANESDPWLAPDGHTLFFQRNVAPGDNDLYMTVIELP